MPATIRLAALTKELTVIGEEIDRAEQVIEPLVDRLRQHQAELSQLATAIDAMESTYASHSRPSSRQAAYAVKSDRHDRLAAEYDTAFIQYQLLYKDYIVKLSRHNSLAEEGMKLAKKHHQRWLFKPRGKTFLP